ncbi:unnamed protein product [Didymodactylos carnosus]|uniref:Elongation of very long chain fatty acids protein n=1 Tax=Didymodactylos carnosus TaxID=1234261 RepID=A0A814LLK7_9BILA|nr:unnamed protein product [Didymodactylos carnosus]CAF1175705.1 unnamed protein product [Didymodactylos carnosus]CAF3832751.1 unnamed protein product [Didymodactylos carnosus]CAF3986850.1 unnamed protein product [Didymodactylos carnosus]
METIREYSLQWEVTKSNYSDPRTADFFMMSSPVPTALICLGYLIFVLLGPAFMKDRKPYNIRNILFVYNFLMVALSGYLFYEFLASGWLAGYSLACQPVDYSLTPQAIRMTRVCYLFYISKFIELMDTIFFIMRKNFHQVTVLHVLHHGIMPISWWFGVRFVPGGFGTFHALLNSLIHFIMYLYYGLASLGPRFQKYLWWKKYMTSMQMLQFIMVMIHSSQLLFIKCQYPMLFVYWIGLYAVMFLLFFSDFFIKTYLKPSKRKTSTTPTKRVSFHESAQKKQSNGYIKHD